MHELKLNSVITLPPNYQNSFYYEKNNCCVNRWYCHAFIMFLPNMPDVYKEYHGRREECPNLV
jgi:hypothetical protein